MKIVALIICFFAAFLPNVSNAQNNAPQPPTTVNVEAKVTSDTISLAEYAGEYKITAGDFDKLNIVLKHGKLIGSIEGQGESELEPTDKKDIFVITNYQAPLEFFRDENGKLKKLRFSVSGQDFEAER